MKAIVYEKYGPPDVLRLEKIQKPTPGDDEVLEKIYATSVNYGDWGNLRDKPFIMRMF